MKPIFFLENEMSSVISAALDGVKPARYQRRLLHLLHKDRYFKREKLPRRLLSGLVLGVFIAIAGSLWQLMELGFVESLLLYTWFVILVVFVEKSFNRYRKKRFLARLFFQKSIRPNMCMRCFCDLREIEAVNCPKCGEPLAPSREIDEQKLTS